MIPATWHPGELPDDEYLRSEAILDAYERHDYKRAAELEAEQLAAERARVEGTG